MTEVELLTTAEIALRRPPIAANPILGAGSVILIVLLHDAHEVLQPDLC